MPKAALQAGIDYCAEQTGVTVTVNTVEPQRLPERHHARTSRATPDDIFTWFAGLPPEVLRRPGPADAHRRRLGERRRQLLRRLQDGRHGQRRQDLHGPVGNYPWVVMYRKSVFEDKGYTVPTTWDEFTALADKMKTDGLIPMAFARQGRLAGHGHVRHPQHAHQRLPVPRRPDGRQGEVDRPEGHRGVRGLEEAAARTTPMEPSA